MKLLVIVNNFFEFGMLFGHLCVQSQFIRDKQIRLVVFYCIDAFEADDTIIKCAWIVNLRLDDSIGVAPFVKSRIFVEYRKVRESLPEL